MATGVKAWSTTADSNATADANVNYAEGQLAPTLNNSARAAMAAIAAFYDQIGGGATMGGSSNAYTVTSAAAGAWSSYATGDLIMIIANHTNTGAATLNVDSLGTKAITKNGTTALSAGDIVSGGAYLLTYDGTRFVMVGEVSSGTFQPVDALLTAIAALTTSADRFLKFTGTDTVAVFDLFGTANSWTAAQTGPSWALTGGTSGTSIAAGVVYFHGDTNDVLSYNQAANVWNLAIGGNVLLSISETVAEFDTLDIRIEPSPVSLASNSAGFRGTIINTQDADYTLVIGDSGKTIRHTSGSAHAWTIPPVSSVASPIGTMARFRNVGSGAVTITRGSGVALRMAGLSTDQNVTLAQWGDAVATMEASDTWVISGTGIS